MFHIYFDDNDELFFKQLSAKELYDFYTIDNINPNRFVILCGENENDIINLSTEN